MRVLITGACGFLGQHVVRGLQDHGIETVALGRSLPLGMARRNWVPADLLADVDFDTVLKDVQATHLLHLAWYTQHGDYWESPLNLRWMDASLRLLQAFAAQGGRYAMMAGSCAEYDWSHGYLREDSTPLSPATLYGTAKDATRRLATAWGASCDLQLAWAHIFYPFGPGETDKRLIPSLVRVFRGQQPPFGVNASAYRGLLPVADAASALVHLLTHEHTGRFNICSGQPVRVEHLVREIARLCNANPELVLALASARLGDPPLLVGDNQRLLATGWRPTQTLLQGLEFQLASLA
ncbi:NAD dependent epimerase/dehydratase family protein [gamma proteobacterium HdN1]|nr:NAD dependent epimerase/dehydratase family protein [gamma proteobacterium HdN1]